MKKRRGKRSFSERLVRRFFYKYYARNLLYELQLRARRTSADYVEARMQDAIIFSSLREILEFCVERASAEGLILEFGVAGGGSINIIAEASAGRTVHGFDSFEGLPLDWAGHVEKRGSFSQSGRPPRVRPNVRLHTGWFSETIPPFKQQHGESIAFLHVDCDLYQSTRDVLWHLSDRITRGTIIEFDEYFNYPNWQQHEFRAWQEFVMQFSVKYRYLAMTAADGRVAVEVTAVGGDR